MAYSQGTGSIPFTFTGATEVCDEATGVSSGERIGGTINSDTDAELGHDITADTGETNSMLCVVFR